MLLRISNLKGLDEKQEKEKSLMAPHLHCCPLNLRLELIRIFPKLWNEAAAKNAVVMFRDRHHLRVGISQRVEIQS